eukprot:9471831-Pyramimonas_sp.AAC.1
MDKLRNESLVSRMQPSHTDELRVTDRTAVASQHGAPPRVGALAPGPIVGDRYAHSRAELLHYSVGPNFVGL